MATDLIQTLLGRVGHRDGHTLLLEAGTPVRLGLGEGQTRNLTGRPLTREDVLQALAPIADPESAARLGAGPLTFGYDCPGVGSFVVCVEDDGVAIRAAIAPGGADGQPLVPAPAPQAEQTAWIPPVETAAPVTEPDTMPVAAASPAEAVPAAPPEQAPPLAFVPADVPGPPVEVGRPAIDRYFHQMYAIGSSDLHLSSGMPPLVRKDGEMQPLDPSAGPLDHTSMVALLDPIMPEGNREEFARRHDTDFAYEIPGLARFRANVFMDRKGRGAVFRVIPSKILTAEDLGLSSHILQLCRLNKGLVLVTGPTGSGKSTTLCAMVDYVNRNRTDHIITIEDPIEFVHENKSCLINQREVRTHTDSFKDALRAALREDPDILLVGEMRDLETVAIAIETAETGHLVFGTLHTTTAASTVDRIIDQFPADRQGQIRVMLSESLRGVISQTLCRKIGGGRVAALEVLIVTSAVSNLIREGKTFQIPSMMQVGKSVGMVSLNDSLLTLVTKKLVAPEEAYAKAVDKSGFEAALKRAGFDLKVPASAVA